jgi:DNA-binding MarR family transcriptional regulator
VKFTDSEVFKLHEIVIRLDTIAQKAVLAPVGLTYAEFLVLMAVRELPQPRQQDVSGMIGASKSLVSQRVKSLAAKRLLRQTVNENNRREHQLELTRKGSEVLVSAYAALLDAAHGVFAALGKERAALGGLLDRTLEQIRKTEKSLVPYEKGKVRE